MPLFEVLAQRSQLKCELCSSQNLVVVYEVKPASRVDETTALMICQTCRSQVENPETLDVEHWRCLNGSIWSEFSPVKVMSYRVLNLLRNESWAQDLLSQMYLEDDLLEWATSGLAKEKHETDTDAPTLDSNGTRLQDGDSVTLIKDLEVKGAGFTAKRGTLVKSISLTNNPKHIEGKVSGVQIVLVAAYLKKV